MPGRVACCSTSPLRRPCLRPHSNTAFAGVIDEIHLAISPVLFGQGETLFEGIDLPALGYRVKEHVSTAAAMHLVVVR